MSLCLSAVFSSPTIQHPFIPYLLFPYYVFLIILICLGLILIVLYYCYVAPRNSDITVSIHCRSNNNNSSAATGGETGGVGAGTRPQNMRRVWRYKDLPPSYDSIHFSDLPPHYEVIFFIFSTIRY